MTSRAKEQKYVGSKSSTAPIQIDSFVELTAALSQAPELAAYQFEMPMDGVASLQKDDITLIFFEERAWQDESAVSVFLSKASDSGLCFICTGSDEALEAMPPALDSANFRALALPCRMRQLAFEVQNFHRLQMMVLRSERANKNVNETNEHVKYVLRVSRELNGVRDSKKLLSLILQKAREITNADAGSIYTVDWNDQRASDSKIIFKVTQNESVFQELEEFVIPVSEHSMVGNAVLYQNAINIPDLYLLDEDPTKNPYYAKHDKTFDLRTGYQCRSMLTIPMYDISYRVIGVIQLINRKRPSTKNLKGIKDFAEYVLPFDDTDVEYAEIVAQQAGIALENAMLTLEKEQLFEGFVHAAVTAIEQRDPTTSGHSHRVAKLTVGLAEIINRIDNGRFKDVSFDKKQLKEIEYASLLHDFGKLGVREQVLVKAKKLYPWEMDLLLERFEHIRARYEIEYLREHIAFLNGQTPIAPGFGAETFRATFDSRINELEDFLQFILKSNEPTVLEQGGFERLKDIANMSFKDARQRSRPLLNYRELEALSVSRGSLTREEFAEIQSHVVHTYEFLRKIPWGRSFPNVPQIAAKHHEKLDGTGYPGGSHDEEIPVQTRMMTIADIFDALTASDRPYKKAVPVIRALEIIEMEVKAGKVDTDLFNVFVDSQIYHAVIDKNQQAS